MALLQATPALPSGEYEIDPDGPDAGMSPFVVYCDMTTGGGGWTTLPLRFNDPNYWSITQSGSACVTVDTQDNNGNYRQYQSSNVGTFADTFMKFVPPIPVRSVRFVNFGHTNGGANNTMDFIIGGVPSGANTSFEGWYFANAANSLAPVGYVFATTTQCASPYDVEYTPASCSRDNAIAQDGGATGPFLLDETITLASTVANLDMALVQGCQSLLETPITSGEQFHVATAPGTDGVWSTGIQVR